MKKKTRKKHKQALTPEGIQALSVTPNPFKMTLNYHEFLNMKSDVYIVKTSGSQIKCPLYGSANSAEA